MPGQPTPPLVQTAFAINAGPSFIENPIPLTTADPERASFDQGFPPQTMTSILAGGTPPYGQDVNGILYMVTSHIAALQAGQPYLYNSTLATAMGGYNVGTVLGMSDGSGVWINTLTGNATDPDGGSAANWMPLYSQGMASISGLTGGVRTLTAAESRRTIVVLTGTLAGNLQVVLPSGVVGRRQWLIVNATTGAFSTTVKTAAGTGVVVPQGGFSAPTEVYGDGTNVYFTVAPVSLPIDQNPTALTIAQRTNSGYLFATYFNQTSPPESFTMSTVFAEAGSDGFHRKITPANFALQVVPLRSIGWGQAYSAPTRALDTAYTNSTNRPIAVNVNYLMLANVGSQSAYGVVGGVIAAGNSWAISGSNQHAFMTFIVPPGVTYSVNTTGAAVLEGWNELA